MRRASACSAHDKAWQHGACGEVTFKDCKVPAGNLLGDDAAALLTGAATPGRGIPLAQALNLGIGRAAYEAALDYAHLRVQGGRPLIEHQAIATKLAEIAIRLEVARAAVWQAAWASDHPEAVADRSLADLPLHDHRAGVHVRGGDEGRPRTAAEIFGAMGVMRDMPLQKYIHDARVCHAHRRRQYRRQAAHRRRARRLPARRPAARWRWPANNQTFQVRMLPWTSL